MPLQFAEQPDNAKPTTGATSDQSDTSQTGHTLLHDTSYTQVPGASSGVLAECTQPGSSTQKPSSPVKTIGEYAVGGALTGAALGAAWNSVSNGMIRLDYRSNKQELKDLNEDYVGRRDRYLAYVQQEINKREEPGRIGAARRFAAATAAGDQHIDDSIYSENFPFDAEHPKLLDRFAPGNNLDAMDDAVRTFLASTQDQILDSIHVIEPFMLPQQSMDIATMRTNLAAAKEHEDRVKLLDGIIDKDPQELIKNVSIPQFLTKKENTAFAGYINKIRINDESIKTHEVDQSRFLDVLSKFKKMDPQQVKDGIKDLEAKGGKANTSMANLLREKQGINDLLTVVRNDEQAVADRLKDDVADKFRILKTQIRDSYQKFTALKEKIREPNATREDELDIDNLRATRKRLRDNKAGNPTDADLDLAKLLRGAPPVFKGQSVKIEPKEFDKFSHLLDVSQKNPAQAKSLLRTVGESGEGIGRTWGRIKKGAGVGVIVAGLGAAFVEYETENSGSSSKTVSQCEADYGHNLLDKGSLIPSAVTGTNSPAYILEGQNYDFGSQSLSVLEKASTDASFNNLSEGEKGTFDRQINDDKAKILEQPHDMKAITNELSDSPFMADTQKRNAITQQLEARIKTVGNPSNGFDNKTKAKASRDLAVWFIAIADAANQHRINVPSGEIEQYEKGAQFVLGKAEQEDPNNQDLTQLKAML